jgi:hypothetical protein
MSSVNNGENALHIGIARHDSPYSEVKKPQKGAMKKRF